MYHRFMNSVKEEVLKALIGSIESIKSKDVDSLIELHSKNGYTLFNDAPPFHLLEDEMALRLKLSLLSQVQDLNYEVRNINLKVYGNIAVVAYELEMAGILVYQYRFEGQKWSRKIRCTSILALEDDGWKVVHEHFSPITASSSTIL